MLVDARPGAPWRAMFRIAEPSPQLAEAIYCIGQAIGTVTSIEGKSRLDALQGLCEEDRPGEDEVETLVRRVLRSTLYQLRAREGPEVQLEGATWNLRLASRVSSKWSAAWT